jgi:hypothetical protein
MTLRDASILAVARFSTELQGWASDMYIESDPGLTAARDTSLTKTRNSFIEAWMDFMDHDGMTLNV